MSPSPNRRKSIAVTHQINKPRPAHKRRPHSITPGDSVLKQLSPASRARRSIGPRKSILKSRPSLNPSDADDVTQTMDFTRDIRGSVNENATRKSLGRRVSFASHAQVRVFEKDANRGDTPPSGTNHPGQSTQPGANVNDENDYPGAPSMVRRRSSSRRSVAFSENGEASMDVDSEVGSSPLPAGFLTQASFIQDEEPDDVSGVWDEEADMDITTGLTSSKPRKSSLGLSNLPPPEDVTESANDLSVEKAEPTEPEPPSAEWLALRAMTHAGGDDPYEPPPSDVDEDGPLIHEDTAGLGEDMDLTEAETRLRRMRESLGLTNTAQDDSFTSSEGSSTGGDDNQTVNLTNVWRDSLGTDSSSVMDVTNIQGTSGESSADGAVDRVLSSALSLQDPLATSEQHDSCTRPGPIKPTPVASLSHDVTLPVPPIFTKPADLVFSAPKPETLSPSKLKSPASPRKAGTAAFALPVERLQPKKRVVPFVADDEGSLHSGGEKTQSPIKKQALRESPSKQTGAPALTESVATSSVARRSSTGGLRRPSGYFAQRKSLEPSGVSNIPRPTSPKKKVAQGRASEADFSLTNQNTGELRTRERRTIIISTTSSASNRRSMYKRFTTAYTPTTLHGDRLQAPVTQRAVTFANFEAAKEWRNDVQPPSSTEEDEGPPISIEQFFNMTGIRFLDELSAPRRSTILPSQLQSAQRGASHITEPTLADYIIAMTVDAPQLELYSHVAADLQRWIEHSKEIYRQAEEEAGKVTPMLFREYAIADKQTQAELLQQLKLIKANNHATARSQWYDWRLQWVEQLYAIADQGYEELQQDSITLDSIIQQAETLLPLLREEHAQVMREFEREQRITTEIENCDRGYLNELKATLSEQGAALDEFRAEVAGTNAKLERMEEKLRDMDTEKAELIASIGASQSILRIQKSSTQAEAMRLKDELATLEALHLWHTSGVQADLFEFVYASRFQVYIPCARFKPLKDQIRIMKTKEMLFKQKDHFPRFTDLTMDVARQRLAKTKSKLNIKKMGPPNAHPYAQIVQALGDFWSGCAQLRSQFKFLSIKYPVSVTPQPPRGNSDLQGLVTTATVLLASVKAKLYVSFILNNDVLWAWPSSIANVDCEIEKSYGPDIDLEKIRQAILQRMSTCTPDDNHACFLDACIEATLEYEVVG
ncbi:Spc7 kinetochore protein-domain-containing protein [Russula earlei]|uniref:Spc7 kinetochore protein-domain-containing protein n=1 Tax=Russula earlei TaxID=71964 RepID=A0ACC0UJV7_9AGAM|nr:Spc7 kinetochore protein-domain-containing protein [Russula earlei]